MVESSEIRDGIRVVTVCADQLDLSNVDGFLAGMAPLLQSGPPWVVLDLSRLEFVDSTGLSTLVGVHDRLQNDSGGMSVCGVNPAVATLLRLTSVDRLFPVCASVESACDSLGLPAR